MAKTRSAESRLRLHDELESARASHLFRRGAQLGGSVYCRPARTSRRAGCGA